MNQNMVLTCLLKPFSDTSPPLLLTGVIWLYLAGVHPRPVYDIDWSAAGEIVTAGGDDAIRIFRQASSF